MLVEKVVNNNLVISRNEDGKEIILRGKGIGFQKKRGQAVEQNLVERVFIPNDEKESQTFQKLFSEIPIKYLEVSEEITNRGRTAYQLNVTDSILLPLSDHIAGAVKRHELGVDLDNPMLFDIKRLYPTEFKLGTDAIGIIKERLNIELSKNEASLIAFHFANAGMGTGSIAKAIPVTQTIQDILDIIEQSYQIELDKEDWNYQRFITHLKFFVQRMLNNEQYPEENDDWFEIIKKELPRTYICITKIADHIYETHKYELNREEMLYLMLHIERVTRNVKS